MGVKLVVFKDEDPGIAVIFEEVKPGTPGRAQGWHGTCTQCGRPMHRWHQEKAFQDGQAHVDSHEL